MSPTERAIEAAGGPKALAIKIGKRAGQVSMWKARDSIAADCVLDVEAAVEGAVSRYELRPDVFGPAPNAAGSTMPAEAAA